MNKRLKSKKFRKLAEILRGEKAPETRYQNPDKWRDKEK
jgi:hypothetical protein